MMKKTDRAQDYRECYRMKSLIYAVVILLLVNSCATTDTRTSPETDRQRLNTAEPKRA